MSTRKIVSGARLAIRVDDRTLLAVPPLHPNTPSTVRVKVFELVLLRQPGLAKYIADTASDALDGIDGARERLSSLISERPDRASDQEVRP